MTDETNKSKPFSSDPADHHGLVMVDGIVQPKRPKPSELVGGGIYYLDDAGICRYEGEDRYRGQLTYKFWNLEYRKHHYETNTDRVGWYAGG
jgi:hypothetical protein